VHCNNINGKRELNVGENVTYDVGVDDRSGKSRAENVTGDGSGTPDQGGGGGYGGGGYGGGGYGGGGGGYGGGGY